MKVTLIIVNLLLAAYMVIFAIPMTSYTQDVNTASMARALHNEGIITEEQLEKMYPMSLEQYGYRNLQGTIDKIVGYPVLIVLLMNVILISIFMDRKPNSEQGGAGQRR